ncbi:MAG TPA: hypothetical protein VGL51_03485 [Solirubrobacteraceae bacterium]|jgi:hypothetical protein
MTHQRSSQEPDALDDFTTQLLECGAVLSQIVSHMVRSEAAGRSAPDAAPIPTVAHGLIRSVIEGLSARHPAPDIAAAGAIIAEATKAICEEIYFVPLDGQC